LSGLPPPRTMVPAVERITVQDLASSNPPASIPEIRDAVVDACVELKEVKKDLADVKTQLSELRNSVASVRTEIKALISTLPSPEERLAHEAGALAPRAAAGPAPPETSAPDDSLRVSFRRRPADSDGVGSVADLGTPRFVSLKGKEAPAFYLECLKRGGALPPLSGQDKSRGEMVFSWFDAMATDDERARLRSTATDEADRTALAKQINDLILRYLGQIYEDLEVNKVPPMLGPPKTGKKRKVMKCSSIEDQLKGIRPKRPNIKADRVAFAEFRRSLA